MLKKFLRRVLERRHYWRTVGFSELAELYANRMMRQMAVNMVTGVVGVFMYQQGYAIWQIMAFFALYALFRVVYVVPAAYFIARYGPKHATLASNIIYIPGLVAMTQLSGSGSGVLWVYAALVTASVVLYNISYHVSFSKVKHSMNAGREIGFMYIVEKLGAGLSPIVGGFIAYWFGPEATLWAASALFLLSTVPLFFSPEPVMTKQKILFRGFNWRATWRQLLSSAAVGMDQSSSLGLWSLFVAVVILGTSSNVVYAELGALAAVAFAASLIFSKIYGSIIDRQKGDTLLKTSVAANSLLHLSRPFVSTPLGIVFVNIINEAATSGYTMPYLKGMYDMADSLPGYRIVYIALMDLAAYTASALYFVIVAALSYVLGGVLGIQVAYIVVAALSIPIMFHGFPALRKMPFYFSWGYSR